ncbi:uncharacterized protein MKK02DRAFT_28022 [Dioszegia hungarica]|uniref:Uncharacterized protein n=1 Tax=Dioszegia hungarica TaxID=4972 RepID=A0AA38H7B1_9TREE|nr:uncharacterized protein MKK02DRAFT_28022 [Dioszegia hungarica]KAI9634896.1 hypothetical protein MKK02DRAFT_28022 [Dioszegia hungarica]
MSFNAPKGSTQGDDRTSFDIHHEHIKICADAESFAASAEVFSIFTDLPKASVHPIRLPRDLTTTVQTTMERADPHSPVLDPPVDWTSARIYQKLRGEKCNAQRNLDSLFSRNFTTDEYLHLTRDLVPGSALQEARAFLKSTEAYDTENPKIFPLVYRAVAEQLGIFHESLKNVATYHSDASTMEDCAKCLPEQYCEQRLITEAAHLSLALLVASTISEARMFRMAQKNSLLQFWSEQDAMKDDEGGVDGQTILYDLSDSGEETEVGTCTSDADESV